MVKRHSKSNALHRSFRRSYRKDYLHDVPVPGIAEHITKTFGVLAKNRKLFFPFLIIAVVIGIATVGLSGVVDQVSDGVFAVLLFLIIWLVTIFILRHILAKNKITLRDALYNAMTPLLSVFVVLFVIALQCLPIALLTVAYSAAVETDFLKMPFYALVFFVFAILMIVMSGYMLSSSLIALVATSAPGLYPIEALRNASDLMIGQRVKFIIRLIVLSLLIALVWAVIILPLKAIGAPDMVLSVVQAMIFCACMIYVTAYLYLYYRWMLDAENMLK